MSEPGERSHCLEPTVWWIPDDCGMTDEDPHSRVMDPYITKADYDTLKAELEQARAEIERLKDDRDLWKDKHGIVTDGFEKMDEECQQLELLAESYSCLLRESVPCLEDGLIAEKLAEKIRKALEGEK